MPQAGQRKDPIQSFIFEVDIKGAPVTGNFRECTGLGSETELIEFKESSGKQLVYMKLPGALKWENIVLKRGITDSMEIWNWRKKVEQGKVKEARQDGSIIMKNQTGDEIGRWNFLAGWPRKVSGPVFNAQTNEIGIEELEIVHEGIIRDH